VLDDSLPLYFKDWPGPGIKLLADALGCWHRSNRELAGPVTLVPALRQAMAAAFTEDVALLWQTVGRDLGHWLRPQSLASSAAADPAESTASVRS
jgi:catechol-2,3-dioxygenase